TTSAANVSRASTSAPASGASHSHGGNRSRRARVAYGKLETIANASAATPSSSTVGGIGRSISTATASTPAAMVVGTPVKNRPSLGETLNRANRIAAHAAASAQAMVAPTAGTAPATEAYTTTGAAIPNAHMSANEPSWAPNALATPSRRARVPSRPSQATQPTRQIAASCGSP